MNISIKKPCHEDWSKMTPNEKGAFCMVCTKDVIDFTKKTVDEIKDYFSKPKEGKVCGQFKNEQLLELGFDSFFERFSGLKMSRKVAMVIAMSFMPWFFGGSDLSAQDNSQKKGKVVVNHQPDKTVQKDSTKTTNNNNTKTAGTVSIQKDPVVTETKIQPKGEITVEPTQTCKDPKVTKDPKSKPKNKSKATSAKKTKEIKPHLMGDVDINYDEEQLKKQKKESAK